MLFSDGAEERCRTAITDGSWWKSLCAPFLGSAQAQTSVAVSIQLKDINDGSFLGVKMHVVSWSKRDALYV